MVSSHKVVSCLYLCYIAHVVWAGVSALCGHKPGVTPRGDNEERIFMDGVSTIRQWGRMCTLHFYSFSFILWFTAHYSIIVRSFWSSSGCFLLFMDIRIFASYSQISTDKQMLSERSVIKIVDRSKHKTFASLRLCKLKPAWIYGPAVPTTDIFQQVFFLVKSNTLICLIIA